MWSAKRRRTTFPITVPRHEASEALTENSIEGKIQRAERQLLPASKTAQATATTWVTMVAQETKPMIGAENPQTVQRIRLASDLASPAPFAPSIVAPTTTALSNANLAASPAAMPAVTSDASAQPSGVASKSNTNQKMAQWTGKVLIVAVTIGGTLVLAFIIVMVYRWRKRKRATRLFQQPDLQTQPPPQPYYRNELGPAWNSSNTLGYPSLRDKPAWELNSSVGSLLYKPGPAFTRPETASSSRPSLLGLPQQPSRSPFPPPNRLPSPSPLADRSVLYIDPRESRIQNTTASQPPRRASIASTTLPIDGPRETSDAQKRRSSLSSIAPLERTYLKGSSPPRNHRSTPDSWTSPASSGNASRLSAVTSRSSVPRFRSVDSWVGNQVGRFDEQHFQQHLEREIEHSFNNVNASRSTTPYDPLRGPNALGLAGARMNLNELRGSAGFYMQHPGTEVPLPNGSRIPSAILDTKIGPREL